MNEVISKEVIWMDSYIINVDTVNPEEVKRNFISIMKKKLHDMEEGEKFILFIPINRKYVNLHTYFKLMTNFKRFVDWDHSSVNKYKDIAVFLPFIFTYSKEKVNSDYYLKEVNYVFETEDIVLDDISVSNYYTVLTQWNQPEDYEDSEVYLDTLRTLGTSNGMGLVIRETLEEFLRPESLEKMVATILKYKEPFINIERINVRLILSDTEEVYNKESSLLGENGKIITGGSFSCINDNLIDVAKHIHKTVVNAILDGYFK